MGRWFVVAGALALHVAGAQGLEAITGALESADTELRSGIFPAVSAILAGLVLIGAAGAVVTIITRRG